VCRAGGDLKQSLEHFFALIAMNAQIVNRELGEKTTENGGPLLHAAHEGLPLQGGDIAGAFSRRVPIGAHRLPQNPFDAGQLNQACGHIRVSASGQERLCGRVQLVDPFLAGDHPTRGELIYRLRYDGSDLIDSCHAAPIPCS